MNDIRREVIAALNEVRRRQLVTNDVLAERLGVTPRSAGTILSRLTTGYKHVSKFESIERYAEALDVDIIYTARLLLPDGSEKTVTGIIPRTKPQTHRKRKP